MSAAYGEFDDRFPGISLTATSPQRWRNLIRYAVGPEIPSFEDNGDQFSELSSCLGVIAHETRHFHDFLISPFGSHAMRSRLVLALNVPQVSILLTRIGSLESADFLPVPLTTWALWKDEERRSFSNDLNAGGIGINIRRSPTYYSGP